MVEFHAVADPSATKAHFKYTGEADLFGPDGRNSSYQQWTGEGDVLPTTNYGTSDFLVIRGNIDTASRKMRMEIIASNIDLIKYRAYGKFDGKILGGFTDELRPLFVTIPNELFDEKQPLPYAPSVFQHFLVFTLDSGWSLPAGQRKADVKPPYPILIGFLDGEIKQIPAQLIWGAASATKPPRETESRSRR